MTSTRPVPSPCWPKLQFPDVQKRHPDRDSDRHHQQPQPYVFYRPERQRLLVQKQNQAADQADRSRGQDRDTPEPVRLIPDVFIRKSLPEAKTVQTVRRDLLQDQRNSGGDEQYRREDQRNDDLEFRIHGDPSGEVRLDATCRCIYLYHY